MRRESHNRWRRPCTSLVARDVAKRPKSIANIGLSDAKEAQSSLRNAKEAERAIKLRRALGDLLDLQHRGADRRGVWCIARSIRRQGHGVCRQAISYLNLLVFERKIARTHVGHHIKRAAENGGLLARPKRARRVLVEGAKAAHAMAHAIAIKSRLRDALAGVFEVACCALEEEGHNVGPRLECPT